MVLLNMDPKKYLCNGTRLLVVELGLHNFKVKNYKLNCKDPSKYIIIPFPFISVLLCTGDEWDFPTPSITVFRQAGILVNHQQIAGMLTYTYPNHSSHTDNCTWRNFRVQNADSVKDKLTDLADDNCTNNVKYCKFMRICDVGKDIQRCRHVL